MGDLVKVGAAWVKDGKKGKFLSIKVTTESGDLNLLAFKNKFKEDGDNKPYYELFLATDDQGEPTERRRGAPQKTPVDDDDVPFAWLPFIVLALPMLGAALA